ncbi:MAG: DPP IV N-terminal domain-containing protein, partial [Candidatus Binatia bacterium]
GGDGPRRLTSGDRDSSPRWSPDGRYVAFVRVTEKDGKPDHPQLFMLAMSGGDSFQFTSLPNGAGQPKWSPDGRSIAFVSETNADDLAKAEGIKKPTPGEHESDVRVITRAVYRFNGAGYLDTKHHQHIWLIDAPKTGGDKVSPRQLTSGRFDDDDFLWATDGTKVYFTSRHVDEPYYDPPTTDIYSVGTARGDVSKITSFDMGADALSISPNGKQFAFVASANRPVRSYSQPDLWVLDIAPSATPRNLTSEFDYDVGDGVGGDNAPPRASGGNAPIWSSNGKTIVEVYSKEGKTNLARFDTATGTQTDVTTGNQAVVNFRSSPDRSKLFSTFSTPTQIGDLYSIDVIGRQTRLTHLNDILFSRLNLTEPEEVSYTSFDGKKIQAWIQ